MTSRKRPKLVLAIYFQTSGFGFVLLDHRFSPVDWGAPEVRGHDRARRCIKYIDTLLTLHTPDLLVLQDTTKRGIRRAPRIQALNRQTLLLARRRGVPVRAFSRAQVRELFEESGATTKQRIAETIARRIPALSLYVPPPRRPWKSEDARMGIFEAAALVWTYLRSSGGAPSF
jgi:hypothetical protein